jgi:hypothetical protein
MLWPGVAALVAVEVAKVPGLVRIDDVTPASAVDKAFLYVPSPAPA